jgi:hypothetical protein
MAALFSWLFCLDGCMRKLWLVASWLDLSSGSAQNHKKWFKTIHYGSAKSREFNICSANSSADFSSAMA